MASTSDQKTMKRFRESFLAGEKAALESIPSEILKSWERSKRSGVDPAMTNLPSIAPKLDSVFDERWRYQRIALRGSEVADLEKTLSEAYACLFYTDANLTIINQRGNKKFAELLNKHNLAIGQNLKEEIIGTNAVALSARTGSPAMVKGPEHFCEFFQEYVTVAINQFDAVNQKCMGYMCIVTPLELYTPYIVSTLLLLRGLLSYSEGLGFTNTSFSMMKSPSVFAQMSHRDNGVIFVANNYYLLWVNQWVTDRFDIAEENVSGMFFEKVFPEFKQALQCMSTGKMIETVEVPVNRSNFKCNLFMSCKPVYEQGQIIGAVITLYSAANLRKIANRISNHHAFYTFDDLIGDSARFVELKKAAIRASNTSSNVLITGESGTGKELFAHSIHNESSRKKHPFLAMNCAALPRELISSELFGYVDGAFTGARKTGAPGKFELANKGTIFLDEIGDMPLDTQSILLRVLEERRVTRLGSQDSTPVDIRVIAATNKNLWEAVLAKEFRMDLYYRLDIVELKMIPLRERKEDIPILVDHLLKQFNESFDTKIECFTPDAMDLLIEQPWPGNIRELKNVIERVGNLCPSKCVSAAELLDYTHIGIVPENAQSAPVQRSTSRNPLKKDIDPARIAELMDRYDGNKAKVARELGITRATLYSKLKDMQLSHPAFDEHAYRE